MEGRLKEAEAAKEKAEKTVEEMKRKAGVADAKLEKQRRELDVSTGLHCRLRSMNSK